MINVIVAPDPLDWALVVLVGPVGLQPMEDPGWGLLMELPGNE